MRGAGAACWMCPELEGRQCGSGTPKRSGAAAEKVPSGWQRWPCQHKGWPTPPVPRGLSPGARPELPGTVSCRIPGQRLCCPPRVAEQAARLGEGRGHAPLGAGIETQVTCRLKGLAWTGLSSSVLCGPASGLRLGQRVVGPGGRLLPGSPKGSSPIQGAGVLQQSKH